MFSTQVRTLALLLAFTSAGVEAGLAASRAHGQGDLLVEIESHMGSGHRAATEARLGRLEEVLHPLFDSLPKSPDGLLGPAGARYALHRAFVQLHAWQVKGLEPAGGSWDFASPTAALNEAPLAVRGLFDERFDSGGLRLQELAVLAASIEQLVHAETEDRLRASYAATVQFHPDHLLSGGQADMVMDAYMATYIFGATISEIVPEVVQELVSPDTETPPYPNWNATKQWIRQTRREVLPGVVDFSFSNLTTVLEVIADRFGHFQAQDCKGIRQHLLGMEERPGSGRVRLADFYRASLKDPFSQFAESAEYLRALGALDETSPDLPRIIIANYINSPANCVASLEYYAVCCIDECEAILAHLEREIEKPSASVDEIVAVVSMLPSETVPADRTLSEGLVQRLRDVADHHDGTVPLHGRLFAQWLHHAFPRECPYPHASGTISPKRANEWLEAGRDPVASEEEMMRVIEEYHTSQAFKDTWLGLAKANATDDGLRSPMWSMEEELVEKRLYLEEELVEKRLFLAAGNAASGEFATVRACGLLVALLAAGSSTFRSLANAVPSELDLLVSTSAAGHNAKKIHYL